MTKRFTFKHHPHLTRKNYKPAVSVKNITTAEASKEKPVVVAEETKTTKSKAVSSVKVAVENKENKTESNE